MNNIKKNGNYNELSNLSNIIKFKQEKLKNLKLTYINKINKIIISNNNDLINNQTKILEQLEKHIKYKYDEMTKRHQKELDLFEYGYKFYPYRPSKTILDM